jgi:uncharacterized OB-fold protein
MNNKVDSNIEWHSCDACGAFRIPSSNNCEFCGVEYQPWTYLTHSGAFDLLLVLEKFAPDKLFNEGLWYTYELKEYPNNLAIINVYDEANGGGYIGSL